MLSEKGSMMLELVYPREGLRRIRRAGIVMGIGVGAFIDGLVLRHLLPWNHLLRFDGLPEAAGGEVRRGHFNDGAFVSGALLFILIGLAMLWRVVAPQRNVSLSARPLVGAMVFGWGLFTLAEGLIAHHLLGLHSVRPGPAQLYWDLGFLAFGGLLMVVGSAVMPRPRFFRKPSSRWTHSVQGI